MIQKMKNYLKLILVVLSISIADEMSAQVIKQDSLAKPIYNGPIRLGTKFFTGRLNLSSIKQENDSAVYNKNKTVTIAPSIAIFVSKKTALGVNLNYSVETDTRRKAHINTFIRSSKLIAERFYLVSRIDLDITPRKINGDSKTFSAAFTWSPGFDYFFNKHWGITTSFAAVGIGYTKTTPKDGGSEFDRSVFLNAGIDLVGVGVIYVWGGK